MDFGLTGRVALITGGSRGIGFATARLLAAEGAAVVVTARDSDRLDAAATALAEGGARVASVAGDSADPDVAVRAVECAVDTFGSVDILVNNAGGESGGKYFAELTDADWTRVYDLNVVAPMRFTRTALPHMRERSWGRVVNVASYTARVPEPFCLAYAAAKAALVNATRGLARTYSRDGILVNCVLPGLTETDGVRAGFADVGETTGRSRDDLVAAMMRRAPIDVGRMGTPEEVAGVIAFLASEQASWMAGAAIAVDGGTIRSAP